MPSLTLQRDASVGDADHTGPRGPNAGPDGPGPVGGVGDSLPDFSFNRDSSDAGGEASGGATVDPDGPGEGTSVDGAAGDDGPDGGGSDPTAPGASEDASADLSPGVEELLSPEGPELLSYDADVDRVVDRLYRELERKMRIERERRGF